MYLLRMSNSSIQLISPLKPIQLEEEKEQEQEESSSSSSSSSSSFSEEKKIFLVPPKIEGQEHVKEERVDGSNDDDEEDGYHTPTSPKHRIPEAIKCPPAPKKPSLRQPCRKRKACCLVQIKDEDLLVFAETDEGKRSKKGREKAASSE